LASRINGWHIAHHVFDGNLRDSQTLVTVLKDLQGRFGLGRVIFVGTGEWSQSRTWYCCAQRGPLKRRRNQQINRYIQAVAQGPWQQCPVAISAQEKQKNDVSSFEDCRRCDAGKRRQCK
jgi:hypothetical protein